MLHPRDRERVDDRLRHPRSGATPLTSPYERDSCCSRASEADLLYPRRDHNRSFIANECHHQDSGRSSTSIARTRLLLPRMKRLTIYLSCGLA